MTEVARLRDSTQILLHPRVLTDLREELEEEFVVTVRREEPHVRIIGSPTEIKAVSEFLARNGIAVA